MKTKLIIGSLLILILGAVIFDWQYGLEIANRIEANIENNPLIKKNFSEVSYSRIKVSPILSKVTFIDFKAKTDYLIECDELVIKMAYDEAQELAQTNRLEKLTKLSLSAYNLNVLKNKEWYKASSFLLIFKGDVNPNDLSNALSSSQGVDLYVENIKTSGEIFGDLKWNEEIDEINKFSALLSNNAEAKMATLKKMDIVSTLINVDLKAKYFYTNDLKPEKVQFVSDVVSVGNIISFGDVKDKGLYTIDGLVQRATGEVIFDSFGKVDHKRTSCKTYMAINNAILDFNKETRRMYTNQLSLIGVNLDDLRINKLDFNGELRGGDLYLSDTRLYSPLLKAKIQSQIKFDFIKPHESLIKSSAVNVNIIDPNLKGSFEGIERLFGFQIPRSGDELVLELKGPLKKPLVKGVHYR